MPWLLAVELPATLLAIAACVSAIGGCITSILAIRKARDEETQNCLQRLKEARADAERYAAELYAIRIARPDTLKDHSNERGPHET